jgi:cystathionine beta-lyase
MQSAAVMIPEEGIRQKMNRGLNSDEIAEPNSFAVHSTVAALTEGDEWLAQLKEYLWANRMHALEFIEKELPEIHVVSGEATYLLWMDCSHFTSDSEDLCQKIRQKTGLYLSSGSHYRGNGTQFLRMNLACPREILNDALHRLKNAMTTL